MRFARRRGKRGDSDTEIKAMQDRIGVALARRSNIAPWPW